MQSVLKVLISLLECTFWQATESTQEIKRDLHFVELKMKSKYMMKKILEKFATDFGKLLNFDFPNR